MSTQKLDLVEIFRLILHRKWFILVFAVCAAIIGLIFSLAAKKQYTSRTVFIVKSPMNMDRNQIFRQGYYQPNDFFATENDIDNIMTISQNEVLLQFLVDSFKLDQHYGVASKSKAFNILKKHFKITRNDTRSIEFAISDPDPKMAATLVNTARWETGNLFRNYFLQTKNQLIASLNKNIDHVDRQIRQINDSIAALRQQYSLYNVLLPYRGQTVANVTTAAPTAGNEDKAKGMEILEAVTATKDQLVKDRGEYVSLINEYNLKTPGGGMDMVYAVQQGWPSDDPSFPNIPLIMAVCFVAGLFFSVILMLLQASVKHLNREES
ncbi:MAG TPA: Wzz/FepE/Etk N-terminal domain-containing protein [Edaphocola sp.]|nr:Wzz/FepE/Etk N-terminal domain-containing protein [Edaphocola sp.]